MQQVHIYFWFYWFLQKTGTTNDGNAGTSHSSTESTINNSARVWKHAYKRKQKNKALNDDASNSGDADVGASTHQKQVAKKNL